MYKKTLYTIGIDGCRGGWLFSILNKENKVEVKLFSKIEDAIAILSSAIAIAIDMPIGLIKSKDEQRDVDTQIRKELGHPFSSSVFTVPCKQAVYADDYQQANRINREIVGKGISIQAWNICSKIKELDIFLDENPSLKIKFIEAHPELCFKRIKKSSLNYKKKTTEGKEERIELLKIVDPNIQGVFNIYRKQYLKKDVADDDILDSMALAFYSKK